MADPNNNNCVVALANNTAYEIDLTKKKIAIIFNCTEFIDPRHTPRRVGADCDVKNIIESLKNLNFKIGRDIRLHENCTLDQTKKIIYELTKEDLSEHRLFMMFVLSHGKDGQIMATDYMYDSEEILWNPFSEENCRSLIGTPKLFFLQSCQGDKFDFGSLLPTADSYSQLFKLNKYEYKNTLIVSSTVSGFISFRLSDGSIFVKNLCIMLDKFGSTHDLHSILTFTNNVITRTILRANNKDYFSTICVASQLTKQLYFKNLRSIETSAVTPERHTLGDSRRALDSITSGERIEFDAKPMEDDEIGVWGSLNKSELDDSTILEPYKMSGLKKALIFNHDKFDHPKLKRRKGLKHDVINLKRTLEYIGYDVNIYTNYTYSQVEDTLSAWRKFDFTDYDCLMVAMLTYKKDDEIYAKDKSYKLEYVVSMFNGPMCKSLLNKPRVFIINSCDIFNDDVEKSSVTVDGHSTNFTDSNGVYKNMLEIERIFNRNSDNKAVFADICCVQSTIPGKYSWNHQDGKGSWFIQELCSALEKRAFKDDFLTIVTNVQSKVKELHDCFLRENNYARNGLMPIMKSTLSRRIMFGNNSVPEEQRTE